MKKLTLNHIDKRLKYRRKQLKKDASWGKNSPEITTLLDSEKVTSPREFTYKGRLPLGVRGLVNRFLD